LKIQWKIFGERRLCFGKKGQYLDKYVKLIDEICNEGEKFRGPNQEMRPQIVLY